MIKPAAPWVAWGLLLSLFAAFAAVFGAQLVGAALGGVGAILLAVGVYRLVLHADRAAGATWASSSTPAPISDAERARQAEARAALLRESPTA